MLAGKGANPMKHPLEALRPGWRRAAVRLWTGLLLTFQCSIDAAQIIQETIHEGTHADWETAIRRLRREYDHLPFPIQLALWTALITLMSLSMVRQWEVPRLFLPVTWTASYCGALIVTAFLPRPARLAPAHWVNAPVLAHRLKSMQPRRFFRPLSEAERYALEQTAASGALDLLRGIANDPEVSNDDREFFQRLLNDDHS